MKEKKLIYIAGKLNDDACNYIKHCHRMIKHARKVRELGFAVMVPCLDILEGLIDGSFDYEDYFQNNIPILSRCDAVSLVPGWETSNGTAREIQIATEKNIPVFKTIKELAAWNLQTEKMMVS